MNIFKERLTELLREGSVTQKEISTKLNLHNKKLSHLKSGRTEPNLNDITVLAKYFDVSTDYILGISDNDYTPSKIKQHIVGNNNNKININSHNKVLSTNELSDMELDLINVYKNLTTRKKTELLTFAFNLIDEDK